MMRKGYHGPLRRAREALPGSSPLKDARRAGKSCTETYISVGEKFLCAGKRLSAPTKGRGSRRRSAAMRHWIESPFYPQGVCHIRSAPTSLTAVQSFRLAEKKTAIHGQKKRRCIQTCGGAQVWGIRFLTVLLKNLFAPAWHGRGAVDVRPGTPC